MRIRESLIIVALCAQWLAGCGGDPHKPVDTSKLFSVESTFGSEFKTQTKGPSDIDPKLLGQKLPPGVAFEPADCRDYLASGRLPKGTRGRMSTLAVSGEGNRYVAIAAQADKDVPFDAETAEKCKHVTFEAAQGKIKGFIDEVDAPQINGATTTGSHWQIETTLGEGQQQTREVYYYAAYLGDLLVLVTANAAQARDQPVAVVDTDRARKLLVDAVSAVHH